MAFEIGRQKTGGVKKGYKSVKTKQWEEIEGYLVNNETEKVVQYMMNLNGKKFFKHYLLLLKYFKPKLKRINIIG